MTLSEQSWLGSCANILLPPVRLGPDAMMIPLLLVGSLAAFAPEATVPCSSLVGNAKAWVKDAEVIVRARAVEELKGAEAVGGFSTRVRFVALETLKGSERWGVDAVLGSPWCNQRPAVRQCRSVARLGAAAVVAQVDDGS